MDQFDICIDCEKFKQTRGYFDYISGFGEPPMCYCELDTEPQNKDCIKHDDYLDIVEENSE